MVSDHQLPNSNISYPIPTGSSCSKTLKPEIEKYLQHLIYLVHGNMDNTFLQTDRLLTSVEIGDEQKTPEKATTETDSESFIITICWTLGFELGRVKVVYQVSDHGDLWHHRSSKGDSLETHLLMPWVKTYLFKSDCPFPCSFHTQQIESFN